MFLQFNQTDDAEIKIGYALTESSVAGKEQ